MFAGTGDGADREVAAAFANPARLPVPQVSRPLAAGNPLPLLLKFM
jgi:hypothetical protein